MFGKSKKTEASAKSGGETAQGLSALIKQGITLQPDRVNMLKEGLEKGLEFFEKFNESRLDLAFTSFDEEMKVALYEVLFLLHTNDKSFQDHKYKAIQLEHIGGSVREKPYEATAELYLEGAPHGVDGLDKLSPIFKEKFHAHIKQEFGMDVPVGSAWGHCPIVSIHSLGSIGTVGHKSRASDLDLQVQYEIEPFLFDTSRWTDQTFTEAINGEIKFWINRQRVQQKLPGEALKDPKIVQGLKAKAAQQVNKTYPNLYKYLVTDGGKVAPNFQGDQGTALKSKFQHEIINLMKRSMRVVRGEENKKKETLLREKIGRVQDYIMKKYPMAEIYLFMSSNDNYRVGNHGTTLESKEASGSAYELILNYETLMPGIQVTPMVPTHFVMPDFINNDTAMFERLIDYIRFGLINIYDSVKTRLTNLGPTPDMPLEYVAGHSGAVYWEAFKASSGNLPKATLNLFRYEMLLDKRFVKTNIQIIKNPTYMNQFISPKPADETRDVELMVSGVTGVPVWALTEMEEMFPLLLQDPWWQRFKALKIGFHESNGVEGVSEDERRTASKIIDLSFALHVRLSDVFTKPGDTRKFDSHREQVLIQFLKRAFPPISPKRQFLEYLFSGEINSVSLFEKELRMLFKSTLKRVNDKIASFNVRGHSNAKEFEIWYHFYQQNFEPPKNVVERTIMQHLTMPRRRIQIGFIPNDGWKFESFQKESSVGKRFDTFGTLENLPDYVMLREKSSFMGGLADLFVNGYYGIINQGTLKESRTAIEFDAKAMDLGNRIDNTFAFVRPDTLHRIMDNILKLFPYQPYHYLDCIRKRRQISEAYIFLNLLKYGRISILYRDNLRTWYCDEYDHPDLFKLANNLRHKLGGLIGFRSIHLTLAKFFKSRGINLNRVQFMTWVNPNSVETPHSSQQLATKEEDMANAFRQIILQVHKPKEEAPPPEAGAATPPPAAEAASAE